MLSRLLGKGFFFENQIPHPPRHFLKVLIGRGGPKIYRTQSIATTVIGSDKRSQKERDWTKMQLSLPGEGKSHSNLASWHNDNDFCLGRGGGPSTKLLCISAYPKGVGGTPPRYERTENQADYSHQPAGRSPPSMIQ